MTSVDSSSPGHRRFLRLRKPASAGQNSFVSSSSSRPAETPNGSKKKSFAPAAFRGLGCASSTASQAHAPASAAATARSSEDWQGKRARRRRVKQRPAAAAADLWCSPIIALASGDDSVDCVVSHRDLVGRGWRRYPERTLREMAGNHDQTSSMADSAPSLQTMLFEYDLLPSRRSHHMRGYYRRPSVDLDEVSQEKLKKKENQEEISAEAIKGSRSDRIFPCFYGCNLHCSRRGKIQIVIAAGSPSVILSIPSLGQLPHPLQRSPEHHHLAAILLDTRILFGRGSFDNYRDWRLDVDNMTYEELLELGDKIGHVSTGLREEEIASCIRKVNNTYFDMHFSSEMERKCSICQEEFVMNDEVGKLGCGHSYHPLCIKKWLLKKNACPVCKITVSKA